MESGDATDQWMQSTRSAVGPEDSTPAQNESVFSDIRRTLNESMNNTLLTPYLQTQPLQTPLLIAIFSVTPSLLIMCQLAVPVYFVETEPTLKL